MTSISRFTCKHCLKFFETKACMTNHVRRCIENPSVESSVCLNCNKVFLRTDNFNRHVKTCHLPSSKWKSCVVADCTFTFHKKHDLRKHMVDTHNVDAMTERTLVFETEAAFQTWKEDMEEETLSYYPKPSGSKKVKYKYYYCQHNGSSKSHRRTDQICAPKRKTPVKGRIKTDTVCTSMLKVCKENNGLVVTFYPTHLHSIDKNDLKHQPMRSSISKWINKKIVQGISPVEIKNILKEQSDSPRISVWDDRELLKCIRERARRLLARSNSDHTYDDESDEELASPQVMKPHSEESLDTPDAFGYKQETKDKINQMSKDLMDQINCDTFPQHLLPRVSEVLSRLLAECDAANPDYTPHEVDSTTVEINPDKTKHEGHYTTVETLAPRPQDGWVYVSGRPEISGQRPSSPATTPSETATTIKLTPILQNRISVKAEPSHELHVKRKKFSDEPCDPLHVENQIFCERPFEHVSTNQSDLIQYSSFNI